MIFVDHKRIAVPGILSSERARQAYARAAAEITEGNASRRVPIDNSIFESSEVHDSLSRLFSGKCAYCETPESASNEGAHGLDHFRPLRSAASETGRSAPFYYAWLAYDWNNFMLACIVCRSKKENLFPVHGRRAPLLATLSEVRNRENGILVDPTFDRPDSHLDFGRNGLCYPKTDRGAQTIKLLNLNRKQLCSQREERVAKFRDLCLLYANNPSPDVLQQLRDYILPSAPFSGATGAFAMRFTRRLAGRSNRRAPVRGRLATELPRLIDSADPIAIQELLGDVQNEPVPRDDVLVALEPPSLKEVSRISPPPAIRQVEISNFKAIEHLVLEFAGRRAESNDASCLMLLGENATGKSTILESIALTLLGADQANRMKIDPDDFIRRSDSRGWRATERKTTRVVVDFYDDSPPVELRVEPGLGRFEGTPDRSLNVLGYGTRRYFKQKRQKRSGAAGARVRGLFDPAHVLPHPGIWLESLDERRFDAVSRAMREVLCLRQDDELVRDEDLGVCVRASGYLTPLERLSDGYKSLFAMAVDAMRGLLDSADNLEAARGVILIDEIETHLHPQWKMRVMGALRRAMPRAQFIATTHDPLCLRGLENGEVAVMNRDEHQHIERLFDLPDIKGLTAEQLLTSDYFGLSSTADPDTEADLARLADQIQGDNDIASPRTEALATSLSQSIVLGDTAADQVAAEAMNEYLRERREGSASDRSRARRSAVKAFLKAIETKSDGRSRP